jgi:hypothetical protein
VDQFLVEKAAIGQQHLGDQAAIPVPVFHDDVTT